MEHPRASSSDDIECFFSVLRDNVVKDFTLKEVCHNIMVNVSSSTNFSCNFHYIGLLRLEKGH